MLSIEVDCYMYSISSLEPTVHCMLYVLLL